MALDNSQSRESDLDRTDKLPILEGISIDEDVEDDSVRLDFSSTQPGTVIVASAPGVPDLRSSGLDLPSLADSVRSVEARIARQSADYEALNRLYEKARDAQLAAGTRADALASELGTVQSALAVEQHRVREMQALLAQNNAASEKTRVRVEEALREAERAQTEARTLRDALAARETTIAQVMHSLGERDAQLSALQREHAKVVPDLEARSQAGAQLERELKEYKERAEALTLDLKASRQSVSDLMTRVARGESELNANRREVAGVKAQAESYLEVLRTREWRGGFNQNLFREWDEKIQAAQSGHGALQAECDRLKLMAAAMNGKLAEQNDTIAALNASRTGDAAGLARRDQELQESQRAQQELAARIEAVESERKRLDGELALRAQELADSRAQAVAAAQQWKDLLAQSEARQGALSAQIETLLEEAKTHEEEMTVLMAHLNEARRPVQSVQGDLKRLSDELALKTSGMEQLSEENRTLRATLERTRGALEERDLLIRRLERSASNNANVLGRLQTSIERLGGAPASAPAAAAEYTAELVRLDAGPEMTFTLARRTRIGRAPGCELQIDSQSVSRNHAMILKGPRELIVEDLNSTNGVLVNGRKVSRHLLSDGDVLTVGEIQFRCLIKPLARAAEGPADLAAGGASGASGPGNVADLRPVEAAKGES
ncbi:MAG TPA: FHA domain-containing protein [Steroidobacteraceae bacterium]|nr:FHA domain-containing protein [Steroidobacteraceae bacterium]